MELMEVEYYSVVDYSPFAELPVELIKEIIKFLDYNSICQTSQVSRVWYAECERQEVWKRAFEEMPLPNEVNTQIPVARRPPTLTEMRKSILNFLKSNAKFILERSWKWMVQAFKNTFSCETAVKEGVGSLQMQGMSEFWTYIGEWKNNMREGFGFSMNSRGDLYVGFFKSDKYHGKGKFVSFQGGFYEGDWSEGLRHGKGLYCWANGDTYEGEFCHHNRQGYGIYRRFRLHQTATTPQTHSYRWPTKERYEGYFKENAKHGHGVFYFSNGDKFEGEYVHGKRNGEGIYVWVSRQTTVFDQKQPHGDRFEGEYVDDVRNGKGTYFYSYGGKFQGQYRNDERHGYGIFVWPDGEWYEGNWELESRKGPGNFHMKDGRVVPLTWDERPHANYSQKCPEKYPTPQNSIMV